MFSSLKNIVYELRRLNMNIEIHNGIQHKLFNHKKAATLEEKNLEAYNKLKDGEVTVEVIGTEEEEDIHELIFKMREKHKKSLKETGEEQFFEEDNFVPSMDKIENLLYANSNDTA